MKRENRYLVIKRSDIAKYLTPSEVAELYRLTDIIGISRLAEHRQPLECVVVESDWPEYEPTWAAIKARVDAEAPIEPPDNKHHCSYGFWWEVVPLSGAMFSVRVGRSDIELESQTFPDRNAAYKQKNKWLTKYKMFCTE